MSVIEEGHMEHQHPYQALDDFLDRLAEAVNMIEQAKAHLRELQDQQGPFIRAAMQAAQKDGVLQSFAQALYLEGPTTISRDVIKGNLKGKNLEAWICEGYTAQATCPWCHHMHEYQVKSFTDFRELSKHPAKEGQFAGMRICPECRAQREHRDKAYVAEKQRELQRLRSLPYQEYLQSPHWKSIRGTALRRARFRCQLCNTSAQLHVHHRSYEHRGEEQNYMHDVIVLCALCHAKHHGIDS